MWIQDTPAAGYSIASSSLMSSGGGSSCTGIRYS